MRWNSLGVMLGAAQAFAAAVTFPQSGRSVTTLGVEATDGVATPQRKGKRSRTYALPPAGLIWLIEVAFASVEMLNVQALVLSSVR